ncbi:MAG: aminotransferase class I/II-fold pyridoxal phosphate-dependent enzyme [Candidatus Dormibacteraeota bacterium]|nr:aminotransferase class I/II-fold pyridoxal phosphate-dependent enzyme [Candidatus Dormibacteraeota bacterium]
MTGAFNVSLDELRGRQSYKWRAHPSDVLPAFVAEMDYSLAPPIADVLAEATRLGDTGYAWADPRVGEAFASFAAARYGWTLDAADVVLIPDVMAGVLEVLRSVTAPGDGVVVNPPVYPPFFSHIAEARCTVVDVPLARHDGMYSLDLDALERAFAGGARVYLLCNPHNPTGRVFSRADLTRIAELADRYSVLVLSDEIHAPLVLSGATHVPMLSLGEPAVSTTIAFVSSSKGWNTPGLKCAQAVAVSPRTRAVLANISEDAIFRTGYLGVLATIAAYRDGGAWLDQLLGVLDRNRRRMAELVTSLIPNARYTPPEGSYLGWIDCSALDLQGDPAGVFLERGRVALRPGPDFGAGGDGFVRVTMATSESILEDIVQRMRAALTA